MELIELRKKMKKKKPDFIRQDSHKKPEICPNWRKPRGMHSKIRLKKKGYRRMPNPGYRSPAEVRGFDRSGLVPVLLKNLGQLEGIDKDKQGIIISSSLGNKKRLEAMKLAKEKGIKILNIKDPEKYAKEAEESMKKKKELKKQKTEKKEKKKKEAKEKPKEEKKEPEKAEEKSGVEGVLADEEKKAKEKKEKDKALIKKELQ